MEPIWWLLLFIVLVVFELITLGLTTIWFAGGAMVAFIASLCNADLEVQLALFVIVSFILLIFTRPVLKDYINKKTTKTNADSLVGQYARVTALIDNLTASGAATVNGLEWTARSNDPEVKIPVGQLVKILSISGVKLIVEPVDEADAEDKNSVV